MSLARWSRGLASSAPQVVARHGRWREGGTVVARALSSSSPASSKYLKREESAPPSAGNHAHGNLTKIVATIGPASESPETIEDLVLEGLFVWHLFLLLPLLLSNPCPPLPSFLSFSLFLSSSLSFDISPPSLPPFSLTQPQI